MSTEVKLLMCSHLQHSAVTAISNQSMHCTLLLHFCNTLTTCNQSV